jgi:hypothetical protein
VHLQRGCGGEAEGVALQAEPRGGRIGAATAGEDAAGGGGGEVGARAEAKVATGGDEGGGETLVEGVPAEGEGRGRQLLAAELDAGAEPGDLAVELGVVEKGVEAQAGADGGAEAGDEFAADMVARVTAGFVEDDGDALAAEGEA